MTMPDGTTLLAAVIEGRRAIGAERDPATFAKDVARLRLRPALKLSLNKSLTMT